MAEKIAIEFRMEQIVALYDLVEFRLITGGSDPKLLPDLEIDEIDALVGALVLLERARNSNL